jgi:hypothetical protein
VCLFDYINNINNILPNVKDYFVKKHKKCSVLLVPSTLDVGVWGSYPIFQWLAAISKESATEKRGERYKDSSRKVTICAQEFSVISALNFKVASLRNSASVIVAGMFTNSEFSIGSM